MQVCTAKMTKLCSQGCLPHIRLCQPPQCLQHHNQNYLHAINMTIDAPQQRTSVVLQITAVTKCASEQALPSEVLSKPLIHSTESATGLQAACRPVLHLMHARIYIKSTLTTACVSHSSAPIVDAHSTDMIHCAVLPSSLGFFQTDTWYSGHLVYPDSSHPSLL